MYNIIINSFIKRIMSFSESDGFWVIIKQIGTSEHLRNYYQTSIKMNINPIKYLTEILLPLIM